MKKNQTIDHRERLKESELILNQDGSVYHLHLLPEHIADIVILVGDQGRVEAVSKYFDEIEFSIQNREFFTQTGWFEGTRISVLSTGIGTDNIDIAINELDAALNIDLKQRRIKENKKSIKMIRIGTSGSLQEDIPVDSFAISEYGLGFDGLLHYYKPEYDEDELSLSQAFAKHYQAKPEQVIPYAVKADEGLHHLLKEGMTSGITATASGFYAPQGRALRLLPDRNESNEMLNSFQHLDHRIINFEMETAALYGLGSMLGHQCCTVCAVIANRFTKSYSKDYKSTVDQLIQTTLERLTNRA